MNAPDKIYLLTDGNNSFVFTSRRTDNKGVEYIRKDFLLEWAKDNLLECEASNDDADYGRIDAFKKLIEKLNSL